MSNRNRRLSFLMRIVALPSLALLLLVTAAFVLGGAAPAPASTTSATTSSNSQLPYDAYFMEHMMDHHLAAIRMSQVCLQKADHQQLRNLCQSMITMQQKESQQMQMWLMQWYKIHYTPQLAVPYQHLVTFLSSIKDDTFEVG